MSKNLVINGVTYNGIESMEIPTADGEKVVFVPEDEAGVDLPELTNPAKAEDIRFRKEAIDGDGKVILGELVVPQNQSSLNLPLATIDSFTDEDSTARVHARHIGDLICLERGATVSLDVQTETFGDAYPADVLWGKTFTSKNGLKMVGAMTIDIRPYLPKLENPATSNDILLNKESIDADGNKVVGTYEPYELPSLRFPATDADIKFGKEAIDAEGNGIIGSMPIIAAKEKTLLCGASYTIPAGYHDGNGKIVVNSLSNQTSATATEADIATGKTAWVNGVKLTGTAQMGGGMETVIADIAVYTGGSVSMFYMNLDGLQRVDNPMGQYEVVKNSPVIIIYDGSTTLVNQGGYGYDQHYDNAWRYSGHSCHVLSFWDNGSVIYAES